MENELENTVPEEEGYTPRPGWQVWGARIGLVLFLILLVLFYLGFAGGKF